MVVPRKRKKGYIKPLVITFVALFAVFILIAASTLGVLLLLRYMDGSMYREGFTVDDLIIPGSKYMEPFSEEPPLFITGGQAPNIYGKVTRQVNATEGVGAFIKLSLVNEGNRSIFIEFLILEPEWGMEIIKPVNRYVHPLTETYLCSVHIPIPLPSPSFSNRGCTVYADLLIEKNISWVRREHRELSSFDIEMDRLSKKENEFEVEENYYFWYDRVNSMIDDDMDYLTSLLDEASPGWENGYTVQSIVDVFEYIKSEIEYIPDPDTEGDHWYSPSECIARGGGDCEDFSMLFGGLIAAMGGSARLIFTDSHAFCSVFMGHDDSILDRIEERAGSKLAMQVWEDDLGKWLVVEPQSNFLFGWFPVGAIPIELADGQMYLYGHSGLGWNIPNTDSIYIVDIYLD